MFCLGCGAETPPDADHCPVCGRAIARLPGDAPAASGDRAAALAPLAPSPAVPAAAVAPPAPSISAGELDTPGFPRDATGRALLIAVLAMMLDLLAPWVNQFGHRTAPADVGAPILLAVAVLAVALIPLSRPSLRRRPAAAVLPIVVGGIAFGPAALGWIILAITGASATASTTICDGCAQPTYPVADFGLYLFLLGAGVLVYTGYQMFLAAARGGVAAPAVSPASAAASVVGAPGAADTGAAAGEADGAGGAGVPGVPGGLAAPRVAAAAPQLAPPAVATAPRGAAKELALPGTASWNAAPPPPHVARPSAAAGWRRQGNPRHP